VIFPHIVLDATFHFLHSKEVAHGGNAVLGHPVNVEIKSFGSGSFFVIELKHNGSLAAVHHIVIYVPGHTDSALKELVLFDMYGTDDPADLDINDSEQGQSDQDNDDGENLLQWYHVSFCQALIISKISAKKY